MKKNDIINAINANNGTETETNIFTMSTENYNNLLFDIDGVKIENGENKKTHIIKCGKCVLTIIEKNPRTKKTETETETEKTVSGGHGVKSKNAHYIIMLKNFDEKPETITNIGSCAEIKLWIKTLTRKNIEYLRIYDMLKNPCRLSAWIEREPKTETTNK